jgi:hypothetical protein
MPEQYANSPWCAELNVIFQALVSHRGFGIGGRKIVDAFHTYQRDTVTLNGSPLLLLKTCENALAEEKVGGLSF